MGNLVCPAIYDLGQEANVVALSVTEGEDKPLKYPVMFQKADLVLVTKMDLIPHLDFDLARLEDNLRRVMPDPEILRVSARTGAGMDGWRRWIEQMRAPILGGQSREARMHEHGDAHTHGHAHEHEHEHAHEHTHGGQTHSHPHSHKHVHTHEHEGPQEKHQHGSGEHGHDGSGHEHSHE